MILPKHSSPKVVSPSRSDLEQLLPSRRTLTTSRSIMAAARGLSSHFTTLPNVA